MGPGDQSRFWRICRIALRRFRIMLWFLILALLGALLYLNQIGLPAFAKQPLLEKLRARGLDLQFSRLRWRWYHGIVAENVLFGRADDPSSPKLTLQEVAVQLNYRALAKLQIQVDGLAFHQGRLAWPIADPNAPSRELAADEIEAELRLLPGDLWKLNHFSARFAGASIQLAATLTHASAVRDWKIFHAPQTPAGVLPDRLRRLADTLEQIQFTSPPQLAVEVRGDARDWRSFDVQASLNTLDSDTPWGAIQHGSLAAQLAPATEKEPALAEIKLQAESAQTRWGAATNLMLMLRLLSTEPGTNALRADLSIVAASAGSKWGRTVNVHFSAQGILSSTNNLLPLSAAGELQFDNPETPWGNAKKLQLTATLFRLSQILEPGDASWAAWANLAPYALDWDCRLAGLRSSQVEADELQCSGHWLAPELQATQIVARLYQGKLEAQGGLNVATRRLSFSGSSDFDAQGISALLPPASRQWLSQFSWKTPPKLQAGGELILPAWTNSSPDWVAEVKPTIQLRGYFYLQDGAFHGVPVTSADSHFTYSNEVLRLPDLVVTRPEGRLNLAHESDDRTGNYYFRIYSTLDLRALRPLLETNQLGGFDLFGFTHPPVIDGELRGRWNEPERLGLKARVALTNFTFRGESAEGFQTALEYTNKLLKLIEPRLQQAAGTQQLAAACVSVDFITQRVYVTNGFSTADPLPVARAIGSHIGRAFESYRFLQPPVVHVEGSIPLRNDRDGDLHFTAAAGPFEWWKFKVPRISGNVDWVKDHLLIRDIRTEFYRGAGTGSVEIVFLPGPGTEFQFIARVTDTDFHALMGDLSAKTNQLEGRLTGWLDITHAESQSWQSWQGRGHVNLHDGLIWEIPIFGILSPMLDSITPGLGSSRASEGEVAFGIKNGVISTDNMEIRASVMRLQYRGTIDLQGRVDARAQAELLRDTWVVGRVLSLTLWPVSKLFEYKITGTMREPRSEPLFLVPKIMLLPFRALHAAKEEPAPPNPAPATTNAPPDLSPSGIAN